MYVYLPCLQTLPWQDLREVIQTAHRVLKRHGNIAFFSRIIHSTHKFHPSDLPLVMNLYVSLASKAFAEARRVACKQTPSPFLLYSWLHKFQMNRLLTFPNKLKVRKSSLFLKLQMTQKSQILPFPLTYK